MSGLADQFVSNGELNIYQETYERFKSKFNRLQLSITSKTITDSTFDIYDDSHISSSVIKQTLSSADTNTSSTVLW